jgi:hypothetical protein
LRQGGFVYDPTRRSLIINVESGVVPAWLEGCAQQVKQGHTNPGPHQGSDDCRPNVGGALHGAASGA